MHIYSCGFNFYDVSLSYELSICNTIFYTVQILQVNIHVEKNFFIL